MIKHYKRNLGTLYYTSDSLITRPKIITLISKNQWPEGRGQVRTEPGTADMLQTLAEGRRQQEEVRSERYTMDVQHMLSKRVPMKRAREKDKREANVDEKTHDNTSTMRQGCQDLCINEAEE